MGNWLDDHEAKKKREAEEERIKTAQSNREAQIYRDKNAAMLARLKPIVEPILDQFEPHIERANKNGFFMTWERFNDNPGIIIRRHEKRYKGSEKVMDAIRSAHIYGTENGFSLYFFAGDIRVRLAYGKHYEEQVFFGFTPGVTPKSISKVPFSSMQEQDILSILQWLATGEWEHPRFGKNKKWFGLFG
jgi:hypothetical protein